MGKCLMVLGCWLLLGACTKQAWNVIDGKQAPEDLSVSPVLLTKYVNKVYINLLGRKPSIDELAAAESSLISNAYSFESRERLIDEVLAHDDYAFNMYELIRSDLLNGLDSSIVRYDYDRVTRSLADPAYQEAWPIFREYQSELAAMLVIVPGMLHDSLSVVDIYKRCINNLYYDDINMGTENFVVALFQYFFRRYPSDNELLVSKDIVDGKSGVIFFQAAENKLTYIDIFFNSSEYFEGQVRQVYLDYLQREPKAEELYELALAYQISGDFRALQRSVLSSNEYLGIGND